MLLIFFPLIENEEIDSSVEELILAMLKESSKSYNEMMTALNLDSCDFSSPMNKLINANKIKRNQSNKRLWILS